MGLQVERIELDRGFPRAIIDLDCIQTAIKQKFIVLAAGIAAEQYVFGNYNHGACNLDQEMISSRGGEAISDYLPEATKLICLHDLSFQRLRKLATKRWVEEEAPFTFDPDAGPPSFELLSGVDIEGVLEQINLDLRG